MVNKIITLAAMLFMASCSEADSNKIVSCNDLIALMEEREKVAEIESWLSYIYNHPDLWENEGDGNMRGMGAFHLSKGVFLANGNFSPPLEAEIRASVGKLGNVTQVTLAFKQGVGVVYSENPAFLYKLIPIKDSNKIGITCSRR